MRPVTILFISGCFVAMGGVALAIALIVEQLRDNEVISIGTRDWATMEANYFDFKSVPAKVVLDDKGYPKEPHPYGPPVSICVPAAIIESFSCYLYEKGTIIPPIAYQGLTQEILEKIRKPCWDSAQGLEEARDKDWVISDYYVPYSSYGIDNPTLANVNGTCLTLRGKAFPSTAKSGATSVIIFNLKSEDGSYGVPYDDTKFSVRVWSVYEKLDKIVARLETDGNQITKGGEKYTEIPVKIPVTYSPRKDAAFDATCLDDTCETNGNKCYRQSFIDGTGRCVAYNPTMAFAGAAPTIQLIETMTRKVAKNYKFEYGFQISSLLPLFSQFVDPVRGTQWVHPPEDQNPYVSADKDINWGFPSDYASTAKFSFTWDSDDVLVYEDTLALTSTAMAAILLSAISTLCLSFAKLLEMWEAAK